MSPTIAALPGAGDKALALLAVAAKVLFSASTEKAAPITATANPAKEINLWRLYCLTSGFDSISPEVAAELRKQTVG